MPLTYHFKNVIYFPGFNSIGGVETFCYEMGLKFGKDFDITILYRVGDPKMMEHISEVARVVRYRPGSKIICDVFIFGYGWEKDMFDNLEAKEIIQTFHADYICRHLNPCYDKRVTKRFGVAENTTIGIREHYDWAKDIITMYNPYTPKEPKKVLYLISATRLTAEKGYKRMLQLADALDAANVQYIWTVYTDKPRDTGRPNIICMPQRLDILDFIAKADYLVQLSDTEGYSYSIVEALSVGTPVITTPIAVAEEQGIIDGKTGFIIPFDMSNIPIDRIIAGVPPFKCEPRESHYDQILSPGPCDYDKILKEPTTVKVLIYYFDIEMQKQLKPGEIYTMLRGRAEHLENLGFVELID